MTLRIQKSLKSAMLATAAACLLAQTASAAVYVIRKDPAYGAAFPALGWRASGELFVSETCLSSNVNFSGTVNFGAGAGSLPPGCGSSEIRNATIEFYKLIDNTFLGSFDIGTYGPDITPNSNNSDLSQELLSLKFRDGEIEDFETSYSNPMLGGASGNDLLGGGVPLGTFFALNLSLNVTGVGAGIGDGKGGGLRAFTRPGDTFIEIQNGASTVPSTDTLTLQVPAQVPEPGTLALALAALAGAFSLGRRRSR